MKKRNFPPRPQNSSTRYTYCNLASQLLSDKNKPKFRMMHRILCNNRYLKSNSSEVSLAAPTPFHRSMTLQFSVWNSLTNDVKPQFHRKLGNSPQNHHGPPKETNCKSVLIHPSLTSSRDMQSLNVVALLEYVIARLFPSCRTQITVNPVCNSDSFLLPHLPTTLPYVASSGVTTWKGTSDLSMPGQTSSQRELRHAEEGHLPVQLEDKRGTEDWSPETFFLTKAMQRGFCINDKTRRIQNQRV